MRACHQQLLGYTRSILGAALAGDDLLESERRDGIMDVMRTWGPALLAVLMIRTYVFEPFRIPSGSMVPTLQIGDHVVVNKSSYGLWVPYTVVEVPFMEQAWVVPRIELIDWGDPERGDIIVFRYPRDEKLNYIKRVVAIPGDTISVSNNQITLNGVVQERVYTDMYTFTDDRCNDSKTKRFVENLGGLNHEVLTNASLPGPLSTMRDVVIPEGHVFVMGDNRDNSEDSRRWKFVRYDQIKGKAHFVWFSWSSCPPGVRPDRVFEGLYNEPDSVVNASE